jgi:hypothetical protein
MKIMAKGQNHYVVQMTKNEMANLLGYYSTHDSDNKEPREGDEINIHGMYQHLYTHKSLLSKLKKAAKELREFADVIEKVPVPIKESAEP